VGSIHDALAKGKRVIAVPRKREFRETQDTQEEVVRALEKEGRILAVYDIKDLKGMIDKSVGFIPTEGSCNSIPQIIFNYMAEQNDKTV